MTDDALDTTPAATDEPGTATPAPAPAVPSGDAPRQVEQSNAPQDADTLDLLADDDAEAAEGEAEGDDTQEASIKAIGPGEDATDDELAAWRVEHGVPDEPAGYEPPVVEGVEWNADALGPIQEIAHKHNVPQQAVADALAEYGRQLQAQREQIKQRDAENAKAMRSTLTKAEITAVKTAAKAMPAELRKMLNAAVLPDGTKLANQPDVLRLIAASYAPKGARTMPQTDEQRLADIIKIRDTNIDRYEREGLSKQALDLMRKIDARGQTRTPGTLTPAEEEQERELTQMMHTDIRAYNQPYRGLGISGSERLLQLRRKREGAVA